RRDGKVISSRYLIVLLDQLAERLTGGDTMVQESVIRPLSGWPWLAVFLLLFFGGLALFLYAAIAAASTPDPPIWALVLSVPMFIAGCITLGGFQAVAPNDARVLLLFGEYRGSIVHSGFYWVNPFYSKKKITLRIRNFETGAITTPLTKDASGTVIQHKARTAS